ncbi:hypothetical protein KJ925_05685 [Patescibacteria group bacterium]|uniref:Uncharacterized protein n=1 Tax=viral metagenome TaxID=1070528 RepID=A0A6H2A4H1_9ZZZZ|nr:hypothetical protein [Patescibacteria group bacterium]
MAEVIEQPFRLTNLDPVIAEADGTANLWSDIWKYQVPQGVALILKPQHSFSTYLEDTSPAEVGNPTCQVKIEKRDSSESDVLLVYGPDLYYASKEFQDKDLKARLRVPEAGVAINEREFLVIAAKDDATIDASDSYFEMYIAKVRKTIQA